MVVLSREAFLRQAAMRGRRNSPGNWEAGETVSRAQAAALWDALVAHGLLVQTTPSEPVGLSEEASRIRNATLGKGYTSQAAQKALTGSLQRCQQLDQPGSIYPYRVATAVLFGSHLEGRAVVGDVDVAVDLVPRLEGDAFMASLEAFMHQREQEGRSVPWWDLGWPLKQTETYLKARSRILSLHRLHLDRKVALAGPHRVVYGTL
jgi:type IV secretory pathway protease TraF